MEENRVFELTIYGLGHENGTAVDATFDCTNEKDLEIVVSKTGALLNYVSVAGVLVSIDVHKRIGTHNRIKARLKIVDKQATDSDLRLNIMVLKNTLIRRKVRLCAVSGEDNHTVAENYYVFGVKPVFQKVSSTYYVDLDMYSWDRFMDVVRYSRSYAEKRLGADILNGEGGFMSGYKNAPGCVTSGMRVLKNDEEMIVPALEQCDETEYNFIRRNADKYGEFLYFENGVLNLGLTRIMEESGEHEVVKVIKDEDYAQIESIADGEYDSQTMKDFYADTLDVAPERNGQCRAASSDTNTIVVPKNPDLDSTSEWMGINPPKAYRISSRLLSYETVIQFGLDNLTQEVSAWNYAKTQAEKFNKNVVNPYKDEIDKLKKAKEAADAAERRKKEEAERRKKEEEERRKKEEEERKKRGNSGNEPFYLDYTEDKKWLELVRHCELTVLNNQYRITFDDRQMNIGLGDLVTCGGIGDEERYVVVDVRSVYAKNGVETEHAPSVLNRMEVTVIPVYDDCPIPLPADGRWDDAQIRGTDNRQVRGKEPKPEPEYKMRLATVETSDDPYRLNQVRVKYDGSATASGEWVKVLTPFASTDDTGISFKLNKGDRVVVLQIKGGSSFVMGSFYDGSDDGKRRPPYGQRKYSSIIRSNNGHVIAFNDKAEACNSIISSFMPGVKFLFNCIPGLSNAASKTTKDKDLLLGLGGIDITDNYGMYSISTSSDQRKITIESPFGTVGISAAMGITVSAPNGNVKIVGKNVDIVAGNNLTLKSGTNIDTRLPLGKDFVSGGWLGVARDARDTLAGLVSGLIDIPAFRFALELLFKPISGTLKVHSGRYLVLESGDGAASINKPKSFKSKKYVKDIFGEIVAESDYYEVIENWIEEKNGNVKAYKDAFIKAYRAIYEDMQNLREHIARLKNRKTEINIANLVKEYITQNDAVNEAKIKSDIFNVEAKEEEKPIIDSKASALVIYVYKIRADIAALKDDKWNPGKYKEADVAILNKMRKIENIKDFNQGSDLEYEALLINDGDNAPKVLLRELIKRVLDTCKIKYAANLQINNTDDWVKLIDSLEAPDRSSLGGDAKEWKDNFGWDFAKGLISEDLYNSFCWEPENKGQILLSQNENSTISIDGQTLKQDIKHITKLQNLIRNASL